MARRHHVFLIPGFFEFANLGELKYFAHVREILTDAVEARRLPVVIHAVHTAPTASLRAGAHLVGHFKDPAHHPPRCDWLPSGSGFHRRDFERLGQDVARNVADPGAGEAG